VNSSLKLFMLFARVTVTKILFFFGILSICFNLNFLSLAAVNVSFYVYLFGILNALMILVLLCKILNKNVTW